VMERFTDWLAFKVIAPAFCLLLIFLIFVVLPLGIYASYQNFKAPTFVLKKADWSCSASHHESTTIYVQTGNVMLPQTSESTVCDQWSRVQER
jgi:hypothetical protein